MDLISIFDSFIDCLFIFGGILFVNMFFVFVFVYIYGFINKE